MLKSLRKLLIFAFLTVLTQIGGVVYLLSDLLFSSKEKDSGMKQIVAFVLLYLIATYLIVPSVAPNYGRVKIEDNDHLKAHSFFYKLTNRNYVRPEMHEALQDIANDFEKKHENIQVVYLDAGFPFFENFPLFPHLSHNDGKKIDISLVYTDSEGQLTNDKPSRTGYGVYEGPLDDEIDQIATCKDQGKWQYDFPKYLSLGSKQESLDFSARGTKDLVKSIVRNKNVEKIFLEPHLVSRMNLSSNKIRYHGCNAVRHDDHIHFQIK